ncbi:MAG: LCP family protein [Clostridiaceae bacterium]|nr:LCP family protein [Clostridiaceae bacterium]
MGKMKSLKRFIIWGLIIAIILFVPLIALRFTMRAPEGNKTINQTGRANKDVPTVFNNEPTPEETPKKNVYTFLVAGKDKVSGNTDTIMIVRLDIGNKNIRILNIPRDTMLDTDRKAKKINSSYLIGGIEQFEKDVASLTGFYVNRYVIFNIEGVERIIDEIGGVYFDVPRNMNYEDPIQDLYIHIKKGYQHLDGKQAVNLARFRNYPEGDIDRIAMQQKLLIELAKQALKPENILKIPELVAITKENVETDIDINEMLWLANEAKKIPLSNIETDMVPGVASMIDNISYWLPYKNALLDLINDRYNPLDNPITANDISIVEFSANHEG